VKAEWREPDEAMALRDPSSRRSKHIFVVLLGPVLVALPWIIPFLGDWRLYLYALIGFALIMVCLSRRKLLGRVRTLESRPHVKKELRKAA
jgi:hypothetical protein